MESSRLDLDELIRIRGVCIIPRFSLHMPSSTLFLAGTIWRGVEICIMISFCLIEFGFSSFVYNTTMG